MARIVEIITLAILFVLISGADQSGDRYFLLLLTGGVSLPLVIGLAFLIRIPGNKEWSYISSVHQALAIVSGSLALIFLLAAPFPSTVPISETWPAILFCTVLASFSFLIAFIAKDFLQNATFTKNNRKVALLRTSMVFYFAVLFLLLK